MADKLATALFLVEPGRLGSHFDFGYVRLHSDRTTDQSDSFDGEVFTT